MNKFFELLSIRCNSMYALQEGGHLYVICCENLVYEKEYILSFPFVNG